MAKQLSVHFPWQLVGFQYGKGVVALHQEIEHFYAYIQPTATEFAMRFRAVRRIEDLIHSIWPSATVQMYGSFRTGLHLPGSDVDMVVLGVYDSPTLLYTLENELLENGVALVNSTVVLDKASVPVVKFTESETYIKFDISFNVVTGVQAAELVKDYKRQFPQMPKLVMVLKQFLLQHNLNEVYTGGISSYAITLMCIGFLQATVSSRRKISKNLGVLLLKFLDYYGSKFNYSRYGITIRNGHGCVDKSALQINFDMQWQSVLTIEDPIVPINDIGRSSFGALYVKQLFHGTYVKLSKIVDSMDAITKKQDSILGCMLEVSVEMLNYREWAHLSFRYLIKHRYKKANAAIRQQYWREKKSSNRNEPEHHDLVDERKCGKCMHKECFMYN